jgi:hypothetical protein
MSGLLLPPPYFCVCIVPVYVKVAFVFNDFSGEVVVPYVNISSYKYKIQNVLFKVGTPVFGRVCVA